MKKQFLIFAVLMVVAGMAMAQDLEQTPAPTIQTIYYGPEAEGETVMMYDEDPDAVIYYSVFNLVIDDSEGWFQYFEPIRITEHGSYEVKAYAIAPGKSASDTVSILVNVQSIDDNAYNINGVYYKEIDNEIYVTYKRFPAPENPSYHGDVVIPDSINFFGTKRRVYGISRDAFNNCLELTSITLPPTIEIIGCSAFERCENLQGVYIRDLAAWFNIDFEWLMPYTNPLEKARHLYLNGEEVRDLVIPETVTEIKPHAFMCFSGLTSVTLPHVVSIGMSAFNSCSGLISMDLGPDVVMIRDGAFSTCMNHERLVCRAINPPEIHLTYYEGYERVKLFVPAESIEAYRNAEVWGRFTHIIPFIGAGPGDINGDGNIAVSDVTNLIDQLLGGEELPAYADVNGDGEVNIKDITDLIDMLLNGN